MTFMPGQFTLLQLSDGLAFLRVDNGNILRERVQGPTEQQRALALPRVFEKPYLAGLAIFEPKRSSYTTRRWNEPPAPHEVDSLRPLTAVEYDEWITDPRLQMLTLNELWPNVDLENSRRDRLTEIVVALAKELAA